MRCSCGAVKVSNYTSGGNSVDAWEATWLSLSSLRHFYFVIGHPSQVSISVKFLSIIPDPHPLPTPVVFGHNPLVTAGEGKYGHVISP